MTNQKEPLETTSLIVKFDPNASVQVEQNRVFVAENEDVSVLNQRLNQEAAIQIESLFHSSNDSDAEMEAQLNCFFLIRVGNASQAKKLCQDLNEISFVEEAYIEPPTELAI